MNYSGQSYQNCYGRLHQFPECVCLCILGQCTNEKKAVALSCIEKKGGVVVK